MTYREYQQLGGQVRKGEKSTITIFYKSYTKEVENPEGEADTENRRVLKAYAVFSADQCDGLLALYHPKPLVAALEPEGREYRLDAFFVHIGADLRHHGAQAYYEPLRDRVTMPRAELFEAYDHYYATLAHELSHWTGHSSRLDRDLKNRFGSDAYAAEELISEMLSAILGGKMGLPVTHLDHHGSYIASWLKILKSDERAILTAAAKAEEAASHESGLSWLRALRRMARPRGSYPPAQRLCRLRHIDLLRAPCDLARRTRRSPVPGGGFRHPANGEGTVLACPDVGTVHRPVR